MIFSRFARTLQTGLRSDLGVTYTMTHNLGDEIQQLALLDVLSRLNVRPAFQLNRDTLRSTLFAVPRGSKAIINGWICHCRAEVQEFLAPLYPIYLSSDLRPEKFFFDTEHLDRSECLVLYIAIHVTEEMFAEIARSETLERHFARHAPIGCRDLHTLKGFQTLGIPSYFSGCLTLQFRRTNKRRSGGEVWVDSPVNIEASPPTVMITNNLENNFTYTMKNIAARRARARAHLDLLFSASKVRTNRLHAYLPSLAAGVPVEFFDTSIANNIRFSGLTDLTPDKREALCAIQVERIEKFLSIG